LGIGVDVVDVDRFASLLERRAELAARLFTAREIDDAAGASERLAARFAAKEAFLKSLGVGLGSSAWHEIEVQRNPSGRPELVLAGSALELANERGVTQFHVSLSHSESTATAFVIATDEGAR
jgi:holo-[acyl-carrier protein] synthase